MRNKKKMKRLKLHKKLLRKLQRKKETDEINVKDCSITSNKKGEKYESADFLKHLHNKLCI